MKHHNPIHPKTEVTIKGETYSLLFDLDAVATAEDLTDRPLLTGLRQRDIEKPTISLVRSMLFACLLSNHPEITFADVKGFVTQKTLAPIWTAVLGAWMAGLSDPEPDEDTPADPTTAQA